MSRERDVVPATEEFKSFVGGISWQITDRELKESALFRHFRIRTVPDPPTRVYMMHTIPFYTTKGFEPISVLTMTGTFTHRRVPRVRRDRGACYGRQGDR